MIYAHELKNFMIEGNIGAGKSTFFIYLRTDPAICYERILKRKRSAELDISLDYLKRLHEKYEAWLVARQDIASSLHDVPVLVLNCNESFEDKVSEQEQHIARIVDFFGIP
jgi:deoxyadenosine/deoxycytidine kinase